MRALDIVKPLGGFTAYGFRESIRQAAIV